MELTPQQILKNVEYKPGYTFNTHSGMVMMTGLVRDSYHPEKQLPVSCYIPTPTHCSPFSEKTSLFPERDIVVTNERELREFITSLRRGVQRFEEHEADEWLRYQGKRICDPHSGQYTPLI